MVSERPGWRLGYPGEMDNQVGRCLERAGLGPQGLPLRTLCSVLGKAAKV